MKSEIVSQELIHLLDAAKSDMVVGLKLREASLLKLMLGQYLLFYVCSCLFIYLFLFTLLVLFLGSLQLIIVFKFSPTLIV